ncbi:MAG: choice-of-anchor D domain-containing protein [Myxococcota bacterium]
MRKLLLPLLMVSQACQCDDPLLDRTPAPEVEVTDDNGKQAGGDPPLIIEFGDVEIGQRVARKVHVKNTGNAPLSIARLAPLVDATDPICPQPSAEFAYPPVSASQHVEVQKGEEKVVEVAYRPTDGGGDCAIMEVKTNDDDEPALRVYFTARGSAAKFCASTPELDFGDVLIGERKTLSAQVGNCGIRPLTLTEVTLQSSFPPFELVDTISVPRTLGPNEMIDVNLAFAPTEAHRWGVGNGADRPPGVILFTTQEQGQGSLTLLGRGITPPRCLLSVAPAAINFGRVDLGSSESRDVLLANAGDAPCTVDSITRVEGSADFSVTTGGAPPSVVVGPAQTAIFTITFAPTAEGLQNARFRVHSDSETSPEQDVTVEANQPPPPGCHLEADPPFINFGIVPTGANNSRQITVTNIGDEMCRITALDIVAGSPEFSSGSFITAGLGVIVDTGDSHNLTINFRTTTPGPKTGRARITYKEGFGFGGTPLTLDIDLAGNAQAPAVCLTPDPVDFGAVPVGGEARRNLSIQSCGAADLDIRGLHFASGSSPAFDAPASPGLPVVLAPGTSINLEIRYRPTQAGGDLGVLVVDSNDPNQPTANVRLLGNADGLCPPLMRCTPDTLSFGNVEVNTEQTRTVVCRNYGTQTVTITAATAAANPPFSASAQLPATLAPGAAMTVQVSLAPTSTGAITGTLTVNSNACESVQEIQLEATGVPAVMPLCLMPNSFSPREEWKWESSVNHPAKTQVWITPLVINLTDDDGDGVITRMDIPDVVFSAFDGNDFNMNPADASQVGAPIPAVVRALSGDDGHELWTVMPEALQVQSEAGLAAGDIDGDNWPEVIGSKFVELEGEEIIPGGPKLLGRFARGRLLCFGHDGSFKWESDEWTAPKEEMEDGGGPSIADLDQDGFAEVIYRNHVFNHEGRLLWAGTKGSGSAGHGGMSVPVDLDGDGYLDLAAGITAYRRDGTILWHRDDVGFDGLPAVADFELDGKPEVVVHNGELHILNGEDGSDAYPPINLPYPAPGCTGAENPEEQPECDTPIPTNVAIADFDSDGKPEIAVANKHYLLVYEVDGTENWRTSIQDNTGASGPAAFDFEGDGIVEVVYADEQSAFALRGTNGQLIYTAPRSSRTIFEYPAIADVDNDGHANMVVVENEPLLRTAKGVKMLTNTDGNWVNVRRVWNQHAYHITNITESGAVPRVETPHYADGPDHNGFRTQSSRCQ